MLELLFAKAHQCAKAGALAMPVLSGDARVVATHDSDILSYHRDMLWRLCLPTAHPNMGYEYCKSYYGRVSDRISRGKPPENTRLVSR